jgi:hypothetical protein
MNTIKTPLPEKFKESEYFEYTREQETINQLIDVVVELTEVVEGKQDAPKLKGFTFKDGLATPTSSLKEQLMGEMYTKRKELMPTGEKFVYMRDVEAIINRLIP